ncbi:MAG TPA: hypothetical protein VGR19_09975 [Allosphingosinicella sp.]|nr:hypothetical protein [Allosphingosinicella sp.]
MKRHLLFASCCAFSAQPSLAEAPASESKWVTVKEDAPGTNFGWAVELAPAFGDKLDGAGIETREGHAFSGSIGARHNLPSRTYISGTMTGSLSPKFLTGRLPGANATADVTLGQTFPLGGAGDLDSNRDKIDLRASERLVHGWQELKTIERSYTDRVIALRGAFTNVLWLYSPLGVEDRRQFRAGPRYDFSLDWSSLNSDRPDRDSQSLAATGLLGYSTQRGLGVTGSLKFQDTDFKHPPLPSEPRQTEVLTGYVGFDVTKFLPARLSLKSFEVGGEISDAEYEDGASETVFNLRFKIGFGRRYAAR